MTSRGLHQYNAAWNLLLVGIHLASGVVFLCYAIEEAMVTSMVSGMNARREPLALPEWQALHREAILVSQLIGAGVTTLGRASYASGLGEYYTAFFGLSIGIERLAKLILVVDHVLCYAGKLPDPIAIKEYGHELAKLIKEADAIAQKHGLQLRYPRPNDPISHAVVSSLDAFAEATKGRYANFGAIGNPSFNRANEPVAKWWREVVEPILSKHYRGKRAEAGVNANAQLVDGSIGSLSSVNFLDETGGVIDDVEGASKRTGQSKWAQKYGRFYTLLMVRWLAGIFTDLTEANGYKTGFEVLFGHSELFSPYQMEDSILLSRKSWPRFCRA